LLRRGACIRVQNSGGMQGILGSDAPFMSGNRGRFSRLFTGCTAGRRP
jgi:hypothetical protein